jgi:hypothetical protein
MEAGYWVVWPAGRLRFREFDTLIDILTSPTRAEGSDDLAPRSLVTNLQDQLSYGR